MLAILVLEAKAERSKAEAALLRTEALQRAKEANANIKTLLESARRQAEALRCDADSAINSEIRRIIRQQPSFTYRGAPIYVEEESADNPRKEKGT
jgi:hypothetical protein